MNISILSIICETYEILTSMSTKDILDIWKMITNDHETKYRINNDWFGRSNVMNRGELISCIIYLLPKNMDKTFNIINYAKDENKNKG